MALSLAKVFLIGAGPGAQDLMTLRGAKILEQAQIVFYDALVDKQMLELCPKAKLVPVGKRCGKLSTAQQFINKQLIDAAQQYERIVRLKGGDPMIFGRADEEITALREHGIDVEVVPGVTTALAAAASIQNSLTLRGISRSVAFVTASIASKTQGMNQQPNADTVIYYMGRKDCRAIAQQLIESGRSQHTSVVVIESISLPQENHLYTTLEDLQHNGLEGWGQEGAPTILMVGEVFSKAVIENRTDLVYRFGGELNNRLQDGITLTDSRRIA
jgi:uroporphyrin-III C-methyltransferase